MRIVHIIKHRVHSLLHRSRADADLQREIELHIEQLTKEGVASGMSESEARMTALREFGSTEKTKEGCRDMRRVNIFENLVQDARYGFRSLRKNPAFTMVVVATLGLGIGANTTIFSTLHATLLRLLPYREPHRIVTIVQTNLERGQDDSVTGGDYTDWKIRNHIFTDLAYSWDAMYTLTDSGPALSLVAYQLSTNFFSLLGAKPAIGRTFLPDEGDSGKDHVAVLSYSLWRDTFNGDPGIIGREIRLDGAKYTIIGVMGPDFAHPSPNVKLWTPLLLPPGLSDNHRLHALHVIGRLRPGTTIAEAQRQMDMLVREIAREHPDTNGRYGVHIESIRDSYVGHMKTPLFVLQGAALFLFLVACANVANMFLARATTAERQISIRIALGAGRWRLFSQFLAQGMLISTAGAVLGFLLTIAGVRLLARLFQLQLSNILLAQNNVDWISWPVLLFMMATTIFVGVILATVPAVRQVQRSQNTLRGIGRNTTDRSLLVRFRSLLIVSQVALSLVLLIGSALLVRSFLYLQERSFGFRTDHILTSVIVLPSAQYSGVSQTSSFLQQTLTQIKNIPGVISTAAINTLPLSGMDARRPFTTPEQPDSAGEQRVVQFRVVTPAYFTTMGIPLVKGRFFDDRDRAGSPNVVIVPEGLARRLWPHSNPIGKILNVADLGTVAPRQVVGVVGNVRHSGLDSEPPIEVYRPAYQTYWPFFAIIVRTIDNPSEVAALVRRTVAAVDRGLPLNDVRTMDQLAANSVALRRACMLLLALFTALAIIFASLGIYSVISYAVTLRTQEIGIRMALGARPVNILASTIGQSINLTLVGVIAGLLIATGVTRYLSSFLVGLTARDPVTLVSAIAMMLVIGTAASYVPARRAMRVDPMKALKYE